MENKFRKNMENKLKKRKKDGMKHGGKIESQIQCFQKEKHIFFHDRHNKHKKNENEKPLLMVSQRKRY